VRQSGATAECRGCHFDRASPRLWISALAVVGLFAAGAVAPVSAQAHGPVAPVALDYRANVTSLPRGMRVKVVDGDARIWLQVPPSQTAVVLDYRGAPYVRFSRIGVEVNHNSPMWYFNQTPFALTPPANLGPHTPPKWQLVSTGHSYEWHDGRPQDLASEALRPGASFVGVWRVPIVVDGRLTAISGRLYHRSPPSIVWFWPIVVLLLCVLAAWRIRRGPLDQWTARLLGLAALGAVTAASVGQGLHGRPTVTPFQLVELAAFLAFVLWALWRILAGRAGFFTYFLIAVAALWQGLELIPTLLNGFVLIALPAFVARTATVLALGTGVALLLMMFRLADLGHDREEPAEELQGEDHGTLELA
jgi:hypothetical protein